LRLGCKNLGVISGITAAAVSEVAHGGENNASEFTTTEQLALQGLVGGISAELRGALYKNTIPAAIAPSSKLPPPALEASPPAIIVIAPWV
jgi:hypothetical protein